MSDASVAGAPDAPSWWAVAGRLEMLAVACLVAIPPVMVVAHRSTIFTLVVSTLLAVGGAALGRRDVAFPSCLRRVVGSPLPVVLAALAAWAAVTFAWTPAPLSALRSAGEFLLPVAAALVLALAVGARPWPALAVALAISLIFASLMIVTDLSTGLAVRRWAGLRADSFVLNRPALTLLVFLPAGLLMLARENRPVLAAAVALAVSGAILASESGAARLGLLAAAGAAAAAWLSPRATMAIAGVALAAAFALAPVSGELADREPAAGPPQRARRLA